MSEVQPPPEGFVERKAPGRPDPAVRRAVREALLAAMRGVPDRTLMASAGEASDGSQQPVHRYWIDYMPLPDVSTEDIERMMALPPLPPGAPVTESFPLLPGPAHTEASAAPFGPATSYHFPVDPRAPSPPMLPPHVGTSASAPVASTDAEATPAPSPASSAPAIPPHGSTGGHGRVHGRDYGSARARGILKRGLKGGK